jgi:hypothetical protein
MTAILRWAPCSGGSGSPASFVISTRRIEAADLHAGPREKLWLCLVFSERTKNVRTRTMLQCKNKDAAVRQNAASSAPGIATAVTLASL